jgi:hypothetical protein
MNFLELLQTVEPRVAVIARDAKVTRQGAYKWSYAFPQKAVFNRLKKSAKYRDVLADVDYKSEREKQPIGRVKK